jgi:hypothetical protein
MQQLPRKLLDRVGDAIRLKHYCYRTVRAASPKGERKETYVQWIRRCILFHNQRHPLDRLKTPVGQSEIEIDIRRTLGWY